MFVSNLFPNSLREFQAPHGTYFELPRSPPSTVFLMLNLCTASARILRSFPIITATMVLPSALATGGSYCLFSPLFIFATLFFLAPHCVQSAALSGWSDAFVGLTQSACRDEDGAAPTVDRDPFKTPCVHPTARIRRQWDPGISRRLWDPGIRSVMGVIQDDRRPTTSEFPIIADWAVWLTMYLTTVAMASTMSTVAMAYPTLMTTVRLTWDPLQPTRPTLMTDRDPFLPWIMTRAVVSRPSVFHASIPSRFHSSHLASSSLISAYSPQHNNDVPLLSSVDPGFPFRLTPMSFALRVTNSP